MYGYFYEDSNGFMKIHGELFKTYKLAELSAISTAKGTLANGMNPRTRVIFKTSARVEVSVPVKVKITVSKER